MNRISALIKETPESSFLSYTKWGHIEKVTIYEPRSRKWADIESAGAFILGFQPPELWEINIFSLKGNPSALLVGMQTSEATVENNMEFSQKTKNGTALWPSNSTAGIIP